jgi:hypothetical protein
MRNKLERLSEKDDLMLMMDFRQERWDEWVKFCHENGYEAKVRQ